MALRLKRSRRLAGLLAVAHASALALLWFVPLRAEARLAIAAAILVSLVATIRRAALLQTRDAIVGIELREDGVSFQTRDGAWHGARLLPTTFVTPALTVLNLQSTSERRVRHVVLMADSAHADAYRELRVRLRWSRPQDA